MSNKYSPQLTRVKIHHSRITEYVPETIVLFEIGEICGQGTYGTVFKIGTQQFVIKCYWENSANSTPPFTENIEWFFWKNVIEQIKENKHTHPVNWSEILMIGTLITAVNANERIFPIGSFVLFMPFYFHWKYIKNLFLQNINKDEKKLLFLFRELLEGCCILQQKYNYIHLDLKLNNIMFDTSGCLRIIDFGILEPIGVQTNTFPCLNTSAVQSRANEVWHQQDVPIIHRDTLIDNYYIWPPGPCLLYGLMCYSLSVIQLEMIYGHTVYKFTGTRADWKRYLHDLRIREYPRVWVDMLEECCYCITSPCKLLEKVDARLKCLENISTHNWKNEWLAVNFVTSSFNLTPLENTLKLIILKEIPNTITLTQDAKDKPADVSVQHENAENKLNIYNGYTC